MDLRAPLRRAIRCVGGEGNEPTPHRTATNDPSPPLQAGGGHNRVTFPRARLHLGLSQHGRTVAGSTTLWRQSSGSDPMNGSLSDDTGQISSSFVGQPSVLTRAWAQETPAHFFCGRFLFRRQNCIYASLALNSAWAQEMPAKNLRAFSAFLGKTGDSAQSRGLVGY